MLDKEKFIKDIKKDLEIEPFGKNEKYCSTNIEEAFENLDEIYMEFRKNLNEDAKNNIYTVLNINKKEAETGCEKVIKLKYSNQERKEINIKIPKEIKNGEKIIIKGEGNKTEENGIRGDLIIEINIKKKYII